MRNGWYAMRWYGLAALVVVLDQFTKGLAEQAEIIYVEKYAPKEMESPAASR